MGHQPRDDRWIDNALAFGNSSNRIAQHGNVVDPILEEIADPLWVLLEEPQRVAGIEVLGEDEHSDVRVQSSDLHRRDEPFVDVCRRHPDVGEHDVGLSAPDLT